MQTVPLGVPNLNTDLINLLVTSTTVYYTQTQFIQGLTNLVLKRSMYCAQPVLTAIANTIGTVGILPRSPVFVFTDAVASDPNMLSNIMIANSFTNLQVTYVLS